MYTHKISKLHEWAARVHLPLIYERTDGQAFEKYKEVLTHNIYHYNVSSCPRSQYWMDRGISLLYTQYPLKLLLYVITITSDSSCPRRDRRHLNERLDLDSAAVRVRQRRRYCFSAAMSFWCTCCSCRKRLHEHYPMTFVRYNINIILCGLWTFVVENYCGFLPVSVGKLQVQYSILMTPSCNNMPNKIISSARVSEYTILSSWLLLWLFRRSSIGRVMI